MRRFSTRRQRRIGNAEVAIRKQDKTSMISIRSGPASALARLVALFAVCLIIISVAILFFEGQDGLQGGHAWLVLIVLLLGFFVWRLFRFADDNQPWTFRGRRQMLFGGRRLFLWRERVRFSRIRSVAIVGTVGANKRSRALELRLPDRQLHLLLAANEPEQIRNLKHVAKAIAEMISEDTEETDDPR